MCCEYVNMTPFLIFNPLSGSYALKRIKSAITCLEITGLSPTIFSASSPAEISTCCQQINEIAEAPLVIIAGGDGTINAVINSLLPGSATLAVLPLGTSNVLAAELGIFSVENGINRIVKGVTRPISVGLLELEQGRHRFVLMAGIGLDGSIVRDVWLLGKRLLKQGAYALSACINAFRWDSSLIEVIIADRLLKCHSVIICNASRYGGDFIIAPEGDVFSPVLTAICIRKNSRRSYLHLAYELFQRRADTGSERIRVPSRGL